MLTSLQDAKGSPRVSQSVAVTSRSADLSNQDSSRASRTNTDIYLMGIKMGPNKSDGRREPSALTALSNQARRNQLS